MPHYRFTVVDSENREFTGVTQATDREAAMRYLAKTYPVVIRFDEVHKRKPLFEQRVTSEDVLAVTQQLAAMLRAGLTLKRALDVLMGDVENPALHRVLAAISTSISEGKPLSQAMAVYPEVFPGIYTHMVEAGETGGSLPEILAQLAEYMEQSEALKRRVKAAMYYPAFILTVALAISVFLFVFGVHQFRDIYAGFRVDLPLMTRAVLAAGDLAWNWWWAFLLLGVGAVTGFLSFIRGERGAMWLDRTLLVVPVLGPILRRVAISRFARTLSSLYAGGVPLMHALELVSASMGNRVLQAVVAGAMRNVQEGESLSRPLRESGIFTPMSVSMIASGEESGTLEAMLREVADFYDSQVDAMLRGLVSLIEPAVILCVGVLVGSLIIALGLPLLNLAQLLGQ